MSEYIPDPIERGEASAESWYDEMLQLDGRFKCRCGELFKEREAVMISPDPYAPPVCPKCGNEELEAYEQSKD